MLGPFQPSGKALPYNLLGRASLFMILIRGEELLGYPEFFDQSGEQLFSLGKTSTPGPLSSAATHLLPIAKLSLPGLPRVRGQARLR